MSLVYPKSAFRAADLWTVAQKAQVALRDKLSDSSLSVRVVNTSLSDDGSASQWQVRSRDRNGKPYIVYAYPISAPYFDVDRVAGVIAGNDRERFPDAHKKIEAVESKKRERVLDDMADVVTEGNWEVARQLRREYIF